MDIVYLIVSSNGVVIGAFSTHHKASEMMAYFMRTEENYDTKLFICERTIDALYIERN